MTSLGGIVLQEGVHIIYAFLQAAFLPQLLMEIPPKSTGIALIHSYIVK